MARNDFCDIQFVQVFAVAVVTGAKQPEASKRLIALPASDKATPAIEKARTKRPGLEVLTINRGQRQVP